MRALLYADLTSRVLSEASGGSAYTWPALVQGDTATIGFRLTEKRDGQSAATKRTIEGIKVSIGRRDARPTAGTIRFQVGNPATTPAQGTNLTTALGFGFTGAQLQDALNALSAAPAVATVTEIDGSFIVSWAALTEHTVITPRNNRLSPISIVNKLQYIRDGEYLTELRLVQSPVAFADSYDAVLPPAPEITEILAGGTSGDVTWDEVQKLYVPPTFEGAFILKRGTRKTASGVDDADGYITRDDTVETLAAKLNATLADTGETFVVAALEGQNAMTIRFSGDMSGTNHALLEIEVITAPAGDPTVTLFLDRPEMAAVLRNAKNGEIKLPLEVEFSLENEADDTKTDVITFALEVTVKAEITLITAAQVQNIDWLRPPSPTSYRPRGTGQTANGVLHWSENRGDGSATSFAIDHDLATDIALPMVRRNVTAGELLVAGVDYSIAYDNNNTLTVSALGDWITTPPAVDEWLIAILGMAQASQYDAHTHSIAEVTGLQAILDAHDALLAELSASAAVQSLGSRDAAAGTTLMEIALPKMAEAYPMRTALSLSPVLADAQTTKTITDTATTTTTTGTEKTQEIKSIADIPVSILPKDGGLLPAIHDAASAALASPVPRASASNKGQVFQNRVLTNVRIPGGGGRSGYDLKPGEFVGSDGRYLYPVIAFGVHNGAIEFTAATNDTITFRDPSITLANGTPVMCKSNNTLPAGLGAALAQRYVINSAAGSCKLSDTLGGSALDVTDTGTGTHYLFATEGTVTSWYPRDFERELFIVPVNSDALLVKKTVEIKFGFELAILNAKTQAPRISDKITRAQWRLKIEWGTAVSEATPATTGRNIRKIVWNTTPILEKTIHITNDTPAVHTFGARVKRTEAALEAASFTVEKAIYGTWTASASEVTTADFFIRATLSEFDVEDIDDARGFVALVGLDSSINGDKASGKLVIK